MAGSARLVLEERKIVWGESCSGEVVFENDDEDRIASLNSANRGSMPTFILTDIASGSSTEFADTKLPDSAEPSATVEAGESWTRGFDLLSAVEFPSTGEYELRVRFKWYGGEAVSEAVRIGVARTTPRTLAVETASGGPYGDLFCAWTNVGESGSELWAWRIGTIFDARLKQCQQICGLAPDVRPVLSVPGNSASRSKQIAWVEGDELKFVDLVSGAEPSSVRLDGPDHTIIPPLLEPGFDDQDASGCDVVMAAPAANGWRLRVVRAEHREAVQMGLELDGPLPTAFSTAFLSSGMRRTVVWQAIETEDASVLRMSLLDWSAQSLPSAQRRIAELPATLVASDVTVLEDDSVAGAVIALTNGEHQHEVRTWRIAGTDDFRWTSTHRITGKFSKCVLRTTPEGAAIALFKTNPGGVWFVFDSRTGLAKLPPEFEAMAEPINLFFVDRRIPAVAYVDPECGIRIGYPGERPRRVVLSGAMI